MTPDPLVRALLGLPSPGGGVPAGIAGRIDVTPSTVNKAAANFATGQADLADAWMRIQGVLDSAAGMAGTGQPASAFAKKYQPSVTLAWKAFRKAVIVLGGASLGLTQTANNHTKADHASRADRPPGPPPIFAPGQVYPDLSMSLPSSPLGIGGSGLPGPLAKLWPNANVGALRTAASGWRNAAQEVDRVATWLAWTVNSLIDVNSGDDMDAIEAYWNRLSAPGDASTVLGGLSQLCTALGSTCDGYADAVDGARNKMKVDLAALGIGVTLTTAVGIIATPVTGGASDAGAAAADTAEAAAALAPTFRQLVITIATTADTLLTGGLITAIVAAITNTPTIQAIETETTDELEPALEDEMAATQARSLGDVEPWSDGRPPVDAQDKVPGEWGDGGPTKKAIKDPTKLGWRWQDPGSRGNTIRIDEGNPNSPQPSQRVDHVVITYNGRMIGSNGEPIIAPKPSQTAEAHIPLSEWLNWPTWYMP